MYCLLLFKGLLLVISFINFASANRSWLASVTCKSFSNTNYKNCTIPNASPEMTLEIVLIRRYGYATCKKGQTYGITDDNYNIWVTKNCRGDFQVYKTADGVITTTTTTTTLTSTFSTTITQGPVWQLWEEWTPCSVTCGSGYRLRHRKCSTGVDKDCVSLTEYNVNYETCNADPCTTPNAQTDTTSQANPISPLTGNCGRANRNYRVLGGQDAGQCEFPWMVLVYNSFYETICGGSLLGEQHVLTAGHCVTEQTLEGSKLTPASHLQIISGNSQMPIGVLLYGVTRTVVSHVIRHEDYDDVLLTNDIAIVKMSTPLPETMCQRAICLPDGTKPPQQAENCLAMGWGKDDNGPQGNIQSVLQWVPETIQKDEDCFSRFGKNATTTSFCAVGDETGSCQGDSSGPLACEEEGRFVQYGVVSAGFENQCGVVPGLYTRVTDFLDWIGDKVLL